MPEFYKTMYYGCSDDEFRVATVKEKKFVENMLNLENSSKEIARGQRKRFAQ